MGAILEFGLIVTQIVTAVVIYPLVRRQSETVSLGYVTARTMESVFAAIGIMSIISVVDVANSLGSATGVHATAIGASGSSLVNTYEWAFLWGPGLVAGIGNGLMLGYLMYRSHSCRPAWHRWSRRWPLLILSFVLTLFGVYKNGSDLLPCCHSRKSCGRHSSASTAHGKDSAGESDRQSRNGNG